MGVYRIEIASSGRAVCKNTECKKNQVKIPKGDLRFCTQVDINGKQSWTYKHWGCTTPQQIQNLKNSIEDKIDYLDGFDELSSDLKAKVLKTLEEGHVDDTDWRGDLEQNRPGRTKFRSPAVKKPKSGEEEDGDEDNNLISGKPAPKKRGRAKKSEKTGEDEQDEPITKKAKVASKKDKSSNVTETKGDSNAGTSLPPKRRGKGKKTDVKPDSDVAAGEEESGPSGGEVEPQPKQKRPQRKAATSRKIVVDQSGDEVESDNSEEQEGDAELKPTKSRQKVAENSSGAKAKTTQKSKKIVSSNTNGTGDSEKPLKSTDRASRRKLT